MSLQAPRRIRVLCIGMPIVLVLFFGNNECWAQVTERIDFAIQEFDPPESLRAWCALDRDGNEVGMERLKVIPTVVVLFRGHGCYRCVEQLSKLSELESQFRDRGVRIVAITNESVEQMKAGLVRLELPFPVLADKERRLFTSQGDDGGGSWHGVLILDANGRLPWRGTEERPFTNLRELLRVIERYRRVQDRIESHDLKESERLNNTRVVNGS